MREDTKLKLKKIVLLSAKIGFGGSLAIFIAESMHLQFAASAGIITLLTLITTKWGTLKLSFLRVVTFLTENSKNSPSSLGSEMNCRYIPLE